MMAKPIKTLELHYPMVQIIFANSNVLLRFVHSDRLEKLLESSESFAQCSKVWSRKVDSAKETKGKIT